MVDPTERGIVARALIDPRLLFRTTFANGKEASNPAVRAGGPRYPQLWDGVRPMYSARATAALPEACRHWQHPCARFPHREQ